MMTNFLILLAVHWVADFVLQTHWQASNKSKRWDALAQHVVVYTGVLAVAAAALFGYGTPGVAAFVVVNGLLHFATDWCTSRVSSRLFTDQFWMATQPMPTMKRTFNLHWFFVVVGLDQLIHQATLGLTMKAFFG